MNDGVTVLFMSIQLFFLLADMDTAIILRLVFFRAKICAVGNLKQMYNRTTSTLHCLSLINIMAIVRTVP